jgi:hypothetical protein
MSRQRPVSRPYDLPTHADTLVAVWTICLTFPVGGWLLTVGLPTRRARSSRARAECAKDVIHGNGTHADGAFAPVAE